MFLDTYRVNNDAFLTDELWLGPIAYTQRNIMTPYAALRGRLQPKFTINNLRLSYAIARTLCSHHPDKQEYYLDTMASYLGLLNIVLHPTPDNEFLLIKDRVKRLRDFSRTSRIGELAQGINYLFTQERLGYPFIVDYHFFCDRIGVDTSGQTPDFVVLSPDARILGLMESKGEGPLTRFSVKGKLKSAIKQLRAARRKLRSHLPPINPSRIIPCCTKFSSADGGVSTIHYSHIVNRRAGDPGRSALQLFKIHYASWFYMVGDFARAQQLVANEPMLPIPEEGDIYTFDPELKVYWVEAIRVNTESAGSLIHFGFDSWHPHPRRRNFAIGIHQSVVNVLTQDSDTIENFEVEASESEGNYEWFKDATVIRFRREG